MKQALEVLFYRKKNEVKEDGMCLVMGRITVGKTMVQFNAKMSNDTIPNSDNNTTITNKEKDYCSPYF